MLAMRRRTGILLAAVAAVAGIATNSAVAGANQGFKRDAAFGLRVIGPALHDVGLAEVVVQDNGRILLGTLGNVCTVQALSPDGAYLWQVGTIGGVAPAGTLPLCGRLWAFPRSAADPIYVVRAGSPEGVEQIYRLKPDGTLDGSFGIGGMATVGFTGTRLRAIHVDSSGRLLLVASAGTAPPQRSELRRLTASGANDTGFGNAGVIALAGVEILASTTAGGTLLFAAESGGIGLPSEYSVRRVTSAGALDTTYGTAGKVIMPELFDRPALAGTPDGSVTVSTSGFFGPLQFRRLTAGGVLDPAFGVDGVLSVGMKDLQPAYDDANSQEHLFNGRLTRPSAGGLAGFVESFAEAGVVRFDDAGRLVESFGDGGRAILTSGLRLIDGDVGPSGEVVTVGRFADGSVFHGMAVLQRSLQSSAWPPVPGVPMLTRLDVGTSSASFGWEPTVGVDPEIRLDGYWVELARLEDDSSVYGPALITEQQISFPSLPSGRYVFRLAASNQWADSEVFEFPFDIGAPPPSGFRPLAGPARILDTRRGTLTIDGLAQGSGRIAAGGTLRLPVAGRAGLPPTASSVGLNVTVTGATSDGYLTVFPCTPQAPNASNVNFTAGQTVANNTIAALDASGAVCLYASAPTEVIIDVSGFFDADAYQPRDGGPVRLLDTRSPGGRTFDGVASGAGRVNSGSIVTLPVGGRGLLAENTRDVLINITSVGADDSGYVTVYPCDQPRPLSTSSLNFAAGTVTANTVIARVSGTGTLCLYSYGTTDLLVDFAGSFPPSGGYQAVVTPMRVDTRAGSEGKPPGTGKVPGRTTLRVPLAGGTAKAALLNVIAVDPDGPGYLTVYPCSEPRPIASNLNYETRRTVANGVIAARGTDGDVCVYTDATAHIVVDVVGWFGARTA